MTGVTVRATVRAAAGTTAPGTLERMDHLHRPHPNLPDGTTLGEALARLVVAALALVTDARLPDRVRCPVPAGVDPTVPLGHAALDRLRHSWNGSALVLGGVSTGPVRLALDNLACSLADVLDGRGEEIDEVASWTRHLAGLVADDLPADTAVTLLTDTAEPDVGAARLVLRLLDAADALEHAAVRP